MIQKRKAINNGGRLLLFFLFTVMVADGPVWAKDNTIIMPHIPIGGNIENPQLTIIDGHTKSGIRTVRFKRSFIKEILEPVDKDEFTEKIRDRKNKG